jgi:parallel beta-helix repeat protein
MRCLHVAAFALILAGFAAAARADTLNVPSDDFPTIQSAVDAAVAGDVIVVSAGVYAETVTISEKTGITLKGKGYPTIQPGDANGIVISASEDITVSGLEVYQAAHGFQVTISTNVSISKMVVSGSTVNSFTLSANEGVRISKCEVFGAASSGVVDDSSTDVVVEKCVFTEISATAVYLSPYNLPGTASDRAKVSKNVIVDATDGIFLGGADLLVEKNKLQVNGYAVYVDASSSPANGVITKNLASTGVPGSIYVNGTGFQITKNKVEGGGIYEYGSNHTLDRNYVSGGGYGIYSNGSGTTITRNSIEESTIAGIFLNGYFLPVEGNKIRNCAGAGIQVNFGGQGPIAGNKILTCDTYGIAALGGGNTFTGNKVVGCDVFGFYVTGTGNTFTGNKASGNGQFDLADTNAVGMNTYTGNKFGTQAIPFIP